MKKCLTVICFLVFMQAYAIRPKDGNDIQIGIADTAFNYLQGDWVQSYRSDIYFIPLCETACYPYFSKCYADYFKFEVDPVKISYRKLNDTTGAIIRAKGTRFYSAELNKSFLDKDSNVVDTIFLKRQVGTKFWVVDLLKSKSNILWYLNWQIDQTHFYNFYTESAKVVFERTPYRGFGKYLTQNDWIVDPCSRSMAVICLALPYPVHLYLKNDTIYTLDTKDGAYVYDVRSHTYRSVLDKNVVLGLSKDSSQLQIARGDTVVASYPRAYRVAVQDKSKYVGIWKSSTSGRSLHIEQEGDSLYMSNYPDSTARVLQQLRKGNVYFDPIAVTLDADVNPNNIVDYAFFTSTASCTPSYSRFVVQNNGKELLEQYTGEIYVKSVITNTSSQTLAQDIYLESNPVVGGVLNVLPLQSFSYEIYTLGGLRIKSGQSDGGVAVHDLKPATYILKLLSEKSVFVEKFVVKE